MTVTATQLDALSRKILCGATDGTYFYVGTDKGFIDKITIASGAISLNLSKFPGEQIVAMAYISSYVFVGTDQGNIYKVTLADGTYTKLGMVNGKISALISISAGTTLGVCTEDGILTKWVIS